MIRCLTLKYFNKIELFFIESVLFLMKQALSASELVGFNKRQWPNVY